MDTAQHTPEADGARTPSPAPQAPTGKRRPRRRWLLHLAGLTVLVLLLSTTATTGVLLVRRSLGLTDRLTVATATAECRTAITREANSRVTRVNLQYGTDVVATVANIEVYTPRRTGDVYTIQGAMLFSISATLVGVFPTRVGVSCEVGGTESDPYAILSQE